MSVPCSADADVVQAAEMIGSSRQHVVNLIERGELPSTKVGTHRRVSRDAIDSLMSSLRGPELKSLRLHAAVAGCLVTDPERVIAIARKNIERGLSRSRPGSIGAKHLQDWSWILDGGTDRILDALWDKSPYGCDLRSSTPFAGVLTEKQRRQILSSL